VARNFEFAYSLAGGNFPPVIRKLPVAATQTIVVGDVLIMSSGKLAKGGAAIGEVVGIAAEDSASQAAGTLIEVEIIMPWHVYRATATADATSVVLNGTETYDLNSSQVVDVTDTTGGSLQIIGVDAAVNTAIFVQFMSCFFCGA
jgi:hypothetical protein